VVGRVARKKAGWVPDRQDIIWIDCNPQAGQEMRDIHPFLVLSTMAFNARTSLVIGLPMTTADYNAGNPFAIATGQATGARKSKTSYVLCHQPKSFDWRTRKASPHPARKLGALPFNKVCTVLNQIIQIG
jgi:mRNA interferase MazF